MGTILCHLETHLRKLTLVASLNEEGTSNCQRCYRSDQNKGQENQDNGQNNLLSPLQTTITVSFSILNPSKAIYKAKSLPVQSEEECLRNRH